MRYLERHQSSATYLVAVDGSQTAAPFILESGKAVIAMGGFGGTDPAPTLSEFKHLVATNKVHYLYVSGGTGSTTGGNGAGIGSGGGGAPSGAIRTAASTKSTGRPTGEGGPPTGSGANGGGGRSSSASAIDAWVEKYGTKVSPSAYGGSSTGGILYSISTSAASK